MLAVPFDQRVHRTSVRRVRLVENVCERLVKHAEPEGAHCEGEVGVFVVAGREVKVEHVLLHEGLPPHLRRKRGKGEALMGRRRRGAWDDAPSRTPPTRSPSRARTPTGDSPRQRGPPEAVSFSGTTPRSPLTTQSPQPPAWYGSRPQASRRRHPHRRATKTSRAARAARRGAQKRRCSGRGGRCHWRDAPLPSLRA